MSASQRAGPAARAVLRRGISPVGRWEHASRTPCPPLRPFLRDLSGYVESTPGPLERREHAGPWVIVILELGPPIRVFEVGQVEQAGHFPGGFAAGLHVEFALTRHEGFQQGVELRLAPTAARRILGLPMEELAGRTVALRDLLPREHASLCEELAELPDWDARFDRVEALLLSLLARGDGPSRAAVWALARICERGGAVEVGSLARELGYSGKHLARLFREHVGVTPRRAARIARFDRLARCVAAGDPRPWSELALELGFADQPHLVREVRAFTGHSPGVWRRSLVPFADGAEASPEVAFVQDRAAGRG